MDHLKYLLGIVLRHISAFLEHCYGFGKPQYTSPPPSEEKIEDPYTPMLKNKCARTDIMDCQEYLVGIILSHIRAFLEH